MGRDLRGHHAHLRRQRLSGTLRPTPQNKARQSRDQRRGKAHENHRHSGQHPHRPLRSALSGGLGFDPTGNAAHHHCPCADRHRAGGLCLGRSLLRDRGLQEILHRAGPPRHGSPYCDHRQHRRPPLPHVAARQRALGPQRQDRGRAGVAAARRDQPRRAALCLYRVAARSVGAGGDGAGLSGAGLRGAEAAFRAGVRRYGHRGAGPGARGGRPGYGDHGRRQSRLAHALGHPPRPEPRTDHGAGGTDPRARPVLA